MSSIVTKLNKYQGTVWHAYHPKCGFPATCSVCMRDALRAASNQESSRP